MKNVKVLEDNQVAIATVTKPRNKKLEIKSNYVPEKVVSEEIAVIEYQPSELQAADTLTKVVHHDATGQLGLVPLQTKTPGMLTIRLLWMTPKKGDASALATG